jgi:2-dehydropantoate 2-reductase
MNIAVIGVGGVGGYFGGKLCRGGGERVHFIARGAHLEAIRVNGLRVKTAAEGEWVCRPDSISDKIESLSPPEAALVCVKSYDLEDAVRRLAGVVTERTVIIPLLNGIDVPERIRRVLAKGVVCPACVFVGTHIESPGVIAQGGGAARVLLGPDPLAPSARPDALLRAFDRAGINHEWLADATPAVWGKFVFIAAFGLVTAAFDATLGEVMESGELSSQALAVMGEIEGLARAKGVALPKTIAAESLRRAEEFPPEAKTSFQRDVEQAGKPDERDLFSGTILRLGRKLGIETPATRELSEMIERRKPWPGR